ncbi:hypothetical protein [Antarcticirhabdus aurantiaca]|uniref:Uncharacterized protein n=1 Tax=Antarcticirhabdus aurantiaca TaxID=2606717 RepID=A0ACD4NWL3_9HYPH|nr:hypothetical protein [Antarcticirhabdus aurantiaca]WAJ31267.1 hypothetical protein OXU80_14130 [Jeongeuplla avenae]
MKRLSLRSSLVVLSLTLLAGCATSGSDEAATAYAEATRPVSALMGDQASSDLYYIEFRARSAESYGHTFAMFGKRDRAGNILTREVAGLHPASTSDVPYVLGHLVPVPSETGPSDGDLEDQYMTANWRIDLDKAQYDDTIAYIRQLQANSPVWHAVWANCSGFVGKIARHMGYRAPSPMLFPENYINTLKEMNT